MTDRQTNILTTQCLYSLWCRHTNWCSDNNV